MMSTRFLWIVLFLSALGALGCESKETAAGEEEKEEASEDTKDKAHAR